MKRTIAIVTLAVVGLMTAGPAIAQQRPQSPVAVTWATTGAAPGTTSSSAGTSDLPAP